MKSKPAKPIVKVESGSQLVSLDTQDTAVTYSKERKAFMKLLVSCWKKCFRRKKLN